MKALSLTQPWATLIAVGAKRIETRSWSTPFRGLIAIHASKSMPGYCRDLCAEQPFLRELTHAGLSMPELPLGAIVATCRLVYVFLTGDTLNYRNASRAMCGPSGLTYEMNPQEIAFGDYAPGRFGWVLADVVRLSEPIPCRGMLGLWTVPDDVVARVRELMQDKAVKA